MNISQVGKKYGITADTLRYYERIGLIPVVHRSGGGIRDYNEADCSWVEFITCMRGAGLPIDALVKYVTLFQQGKSTEKERKEILIKQRNLLAERVTELQKTLERLNNKIENYDVIMAEKEDVLNEKTDGIFKR